MDEITAGEVARGLELIRADIKELAAEVRERPDWQDIRRVETGLQLQIANEATARQLERLAADKAIKGLEDWNTWAQRLILGALGTGLVGWIVTQAVSAA